MDLFLTNFYVIPGMHKGGNGYNDHNLCKLFSCQFYAFTFNLIGFCFVLQNCALQTTIKKISRENKGISFMDI
jgi:hypothetical protein